MQMSFVQSNDSIFIISLVRIIEIIALTLLWNNTSKMAKIPAASKYYSFNVAASVLVVANIIIGLILNIYLYLFPDMDLNYFVIGMIIAILLVNIGYILLWINTAKMQDDKNVGEFYNSNVASSILIGIAILLQIISKHFSFD
jgi:undecaprenyl pyrophosphate phosphatase UppP